MNKSIKHILMISILVLMMVGIVSTASAGDWEGTASQFLANLTDNITDNSIVTIHESNANVDKEYEISQNNITIIANGTVTFTGVEYESCFIISGNNVTIKGITIKNFDHEYNSIWWKGDNGTIVSCKFSENCGSVSAICWEGKNGHVIGCEFNNNSASDSTLYWYGENGTVRDCKFTNNNGGDGGAICWHNGSNGRIIGCDFNNNMGKEDGGAICIYSVSLSVTNCTFDNNTALDDGSAVYISVEEENNNITIDDCTFKDNTVILGDGTIHIFCYDGNANTTVKNCIFINNNARFGNGGAISIRSEGGNANTTVNNCIFINNNAKLGNGGAISIRSEEGNANTTVNNCTFKNNHDIYDADIYNEGNLTVSGENGGTIYNKGTITNPLTAIILGNETVGVAKDNAFELSAFIKAANFSVISGDFNFTIGDNNFVSTLNNDHYIANYYVTGKIGDEIPVSGNYSCEDRITYETAILLIKNAATLTGDNVTLPYNNKIKIKLNATSNDKNVTNGTVSIAINGKTYTGEVSNGKVTIEIADKVDVGIYHLTTVYEENHDYLNATFDFTLTITQTNSLIDIEVDDIEYGEKAKIKLNTIPEMTGTIRISVNGEFYDILANSTEFDIPDTLNVGTQWVYASYNGDKNFKNSSNSTKFTVEDNKIATYTNVSVESVSGGAILYINTTDVNGNPADGYAIVLANGTHSYSTLVRNGTGKLSINDLPTGKYCAVVTFNSSGNYDVSYDNCSFEITSAPSGFDLIGCNVYKEFENDTQYHVKVTDSLGNPLANMTVLVSISNSKWVKNANYTIITGKDGIATLMINLLVGNYKITAHFTDKVAVNNITVIASNFKLQADNLVKYFKNGTQYTIKVTDKNNNPVANRTVTISIYKSTWKSPVKYYVKTNNDGIATLDINLIAGSYSVTANICYNSTKSSITVLPTLTADSIIKKVNKEASLKAKLVDDAGSPAQGKEVTFTVKDKTYYLTTDANGIATLPIHLSLGAWSFLIANPDTGASTRATVKVIK